MSSTYYLDSISQQQLNPRFYDKLHLQKLVSFPMVNLKLISLCFTWYLTSVVSSSTTKEILKDFKYPVTLTEIQFVMNGILCMLLLASVKYVKQTFNVNCFKKFPDGTFPPLLTDPHYSILKNFLFPSLLILKTTIPMGMFQFIGQIASHNSTSIIPVSLVHTIKALSPLTTVLIYRVVFKKKFSLKTYLTLIPLVTGVMLCCTRNDNLNISDSLFFKGGAFAFISMLIFVSQNIFAKKILTWDDSSSSKESLKPNGYTSTNSDDEDDDEDVERRAKDFLNRFNWRITRAESATSTPILPVSMSPPKTPRSIFNMFGGSSAPPSPTSLPELSGFNVKGNYNISNSSSQKLDKISVLFYCSVVGFVLTLPFYLLSEYKNMNNRLQLSLSDLNPEITHLILMYGLSHFVQSLMAFQILGMVSPVNYSIANILKRIIIISCSILIEGITLSAQQWVGLTLTFVGLYCYDKWGVQRKNY